MSRGMKPYDIPSYFNATWYDQQKELGKRDYEIAKELFISTTLLEIWKRKVGCTPYKWKNMSGRKPKVSPALLLQMYESGKNYREIGAIVNLHHTNVKTHVERLLTKSL